MKHKVFSLARLAPLALIILLLMAGVVPAAMAQGPDDGDGDVEMALSFHGGFGLNPASSWPFALPPIPDVPQLVPEGGSATTEFLVIDVEDLYSVNLAFDYLDTVVDVASVEAGSLFTGLTPDVDYIMTVSPPTAFPRSPLEPPLNPTPPTGIPNKRVYVNISVINYNNPHLPIQGNGSLIKINWDVIGVGTTPVDFTIANLLDEYGNYLEPCYPASLCGNTVEIPVPDPIVLGITIGKLQVVPATPGLDFQIALEGGKSPDGNDLLVPPRPEASIVATKGGFGTFTGEVLDNFGKATIEGPLPYDSLEITRPGYLRFSASGVDTLDPPLVTLLAGDVNTPQDNRIDIFDISLVASHFNYPITAASEKMDFNADGIITIADLALVAKNYGLVDPDPVR